MNLKFLSASLLQASLALALTLGGTQAALAQDKTAVFAVANSFSSLDPYDTNATLDLSVCKSFYQGLYTFDKDLKVTPQLADSYETAKAGIEGMTRALARELGPDNIRVTAVVPGNVKTPRQMKWYTPQGEAEIVSQQCLKARITPEHVASLVMFLASDEGRMCTGHEYWIDAGWG